MKYISYLVTGLVFFPGFPAKCVRGKITLKTRSVKETSNLTYLKKIPAAESHICLVRLDVRKTRSSSKNVFYFRRNSCSGCLIQMFTQSGMWPEIDMQPLPGGSELIWYAVAHFCVIFVLTFCFIMQQVSNRLPERADRKRERETKSM